MQGLTRIAPSEIVRLGRTGLRVSKACLGTMTFGGHCDKETSFAIMNVAEEAGINFFDTANVYPMGRNDVGVTEEIVGSWLRGKRDRFVLATKASGKMGEGANDRGNSRAHLMRAIDDSLRRLGTDYIDLYYLHQWDPETPVDESLAALDDLRRAGKIRYAGASNFAAWRVVGSLWTSDRQNEIRFDCLQPRYNLLYRAIETELVPMAIEYGIGIAVYNPLGGGILTARHRPGEAPQPGSRFAFENSTGDSYRRRYYQDAMLREVARLAEDVASRGKSLTHVALRWAMTQPGITSAIVGATRPEQLRDSLGALSIELDEDDRTACDALWYTLPRRRPADEA